MKKQRKIACKNPDIIYFFLTTTLGTISIWQKKNKLHINARTGQRGTSVHKQLAFAFARTGQRGTYAHTQLAFARTVHINELTLIPFKTQPPILESEFDRVKSGTHSCSASSSFSS
jgi:hypothetical protein